MKLLSVRKTHGFTLIELLIVIALLGALAVGLIGALDPLEQIKKGQDTGTRDVVNQVQTAIIRYYAVKNKFPWTDGDVPQPTGQTLDTMVSMISMIQVTGELRTDFTSIHEDRMSSIFVNYDTENTTAVVCYMPTSKSFKADLNTKYTDAVGTEDSGNTCIANGGETDCYWCIR